MAEFFQGECGHGHNLIGLVAIIAIFGGPLILGGWALWLKHRRNERFDEMKRETLEMGMSADDIVRVLNAGARAWQSTPTGAKESPPAQ